MNKETTKNILSLLLNCQKLMTDPKKLSFSVVKSLIGPLLAEEEFNNFVKTFGIVTHSGTESVERSQALLEIKLLAGKIKLDSTPNQKLTLITLILKLMSVNKEEDNHHMDKALIVT